MGGEWTLIHLRSIQAALLGVDARDFHAAIVSMVPSRYTIAKSYGAPGGAQGPGATLIN
jgi:hypothetical protein